jgi:hypothetical protein
VDRDLAGAPKGEEDCPGKHVPTEIVINGQFFSSEIKKILKTNIGGRVTGHLQQKSGKSVREVLKKGLAQGMKAWRFVHRPQYGGD